MAQTARTLTIPARCNGPASSGNGGWTSGALAQASGLPGPVTVQVRRPPPLETPLDVVPVEDRVELRHGQDVVAVSVAEGPDSWAKLEPVTVEEARAAEASYAGHRSHPFPRCFSCGPQREDGLRIFPGRVAGDRVVAGWTPDPSVATDGIVGTAVTWAALDCAGGWTSDLEHRPLVLAQMCARVESPPQAGSSYAVVGATRRTEGRKTWAATAMFDADGRLVAQAEQLWIAVTPEVVARLQG
jgi:hypothetical protein